MWMTRRSAPPDFIGGRWTGVIDPRNGASWDCPAGARWAASCCTAGAIWASSRTERCVDDHFVVGLVAQEGGPMTLHMWSRKTSRSSGAPQFLHGRMVMAFFAGLNAGLSSEWNGAGLVADHWCQFSFLRVGR
jgi:hypothetical protein